jgi:hypothetical protein
MRPPLTPDAHKVTEHLSAAAAASGASYGAGLHRGAAFYRSPERGMKLNDRVLDQVHLPARLPVEHRQQVGHRDAPMCAARWVARGLRCAVRCDARVSGPLGQTLPQHPEGRNGASSIPWPASSNPRHSPNTAARPPAAPSKPHPFPFSVPTCPSLPAPQPPAPTWDRPAAPPLRSLR